MGVVALDRSIDLLKKIMKTALVFTAIFVIGEASAYAGNDIDNKLMEPDKNKVELQIEYLDARFFQGRDVNLYNVNAFREYKNFGTTSLHYGMTLSMAKGDVEGKGHSGVWHSSGAVGIGPSYMVRFSRDLSRKWKASLDASGSILLYNHAHPYGGRSYGFLWRIGPRVTYNFTSSDAISLGYIFHHASNGMKSKNPGYNGLGFSIGYEHKY